MLTPEEEVEYAYLTHTSLDEAVRQLRCVLMEMPLVKVTHDGKVVVVLFQGFTAKVEPCYGVVNCLSWRDLAIDCMLTINKQLEYGSNDRLRIRSYRPNQ